MVFPSHSKLELTHTGEKEKWLCQGKIRSTRTNKGSCGERRTQPNHGRRKKGSVCEDGTDRRVETGQTDMWRCVETCGEEGREETWLGQKENLT